MGFQIQIDEEEVAKTINESIKATIIGPKLKAAIEKAANDALEGYSSPVKKIVEQVCTEQIQYVLETEYKDTIKEMIAKHLTDDFVKQLFDVAVRKAIEYMKDR